MGNGWTEIGDRVFVRRYPFFDQNVVAILGHDETLLVDTRTTPAHADELRADLAALRAPRVAVVVNTHGHSDHCFGNSRFRPAMIWGHERCVTMLRETGEAQREGLIRTLPDLAADLRAVEIVVPDRVFATEVAVTFGGREVILRYLGRGHTDNDIAVLVPDAGVVCAGDLLENGAPPFFGDGFPMDWPGTAAALLDLVPEGVTVVPGHGDHAGRAFVAASLAAFRLIARLGAQVHGGIATLDDAILAGPFTVDANREPIERAVAQLRGALDP